MIQIALLQSSHSDFERDIQLALERAGMQAHPVSWNASHISFADFQGIVIIGDSSCEDDSCITAHDPIMQQIAEQSFLGKPILGIDTGARILVETGLVPGLEDNQVGMALVMNHSKKQENLDVRLSEGYQLNAFTRYLTSKDILHVSANTEGRFIISPVLLDEIKRNGLNVFQYCDEQGAIASANNIAAISNKTGNVMAMVPNLMNAGDAIFKSMREYITEGHVVQVIPLYYQPRPAVIKQ